jgi:L-iditol 2-dehydrogenase
LNADPSRRESVAVLHGAGDIRIEQRPIDVPGEDEVLVEVSAVGICGSDIHYFEEGFLGSNVIRAPHVLGHEVSGRVVARGELATRHRVGDRVTLEPGIPCSACVECLTGHYNLCRNVRFLGTPPIDGALRGHVAIHEQFAIPLPDAISDEAGALIEPLAVALWACHQGKVDAGDRVLITGAGPIGLLTAQVARAFDAAEVSIVDVNETRLALAQRLGVSRTLTTAGLARPDVTINADVFLECAGSASALTAGIAAVRPAGTVVVVGMSPENTVTLPLDRLQRQELTVVGSFRYAGCFSEATALAVTGRVELEALITARFPLKDVRSALRAAREDPTSIKPIVLPNQPAIAPRRPRDHRPR